MSLRIDRLIHEWERRTGFEMVNARQADQSDIDAVIEGFQADRKWLDQNWQELDRMSGQMINQLKATKQQGAAR